MEVCRRGLRLSPPLRASGTAPALVLGCGLRANGHKPGGFDVLRRVASGSGGGSCALPLLLDLNPVYYSHIASQHSFVSQHMHHNISACTSGCVQGLITSNGPVGSISRRPA